MLLPLDHLLLLIKQLKVLYFIALFRFPYGVFFAAPRK
jgi:hypothetical protein